jgi:cell pole-organizing protein PopZ
MNRVDQAPEPSMEELLASIRLIISDADKKSPLARDPGPSLSMSAPAAQSSFAAEEVLDLTDELVFPEEKGAIPLPPPAGPETAPRQPAAPLQSSGKQSRASSQPAPAGTSAGGRADPGGGPAPRRPIWSRRELPIQGAPFEPPVAKPRQDSGQPKSPSRNWSGDIQMAVPEQGPVSLVSSAEPSGQGEATAEGARAEEVARSASGAQTISLEDGEATVAALALKLARSAVGSMEAGELATARDVDFEHIGEDSRAEVTEKFADAIEREDAALDRPALPTLLDEVLRQDFRRGSSASAGEQEAEEPVPLQSEGQETGQRQSAPDQIRFAPRHAPAASEEMPAQPSPAAMQAVVQAQALVPAQAPAVTLPIRSLEDAVREMLRPLLVQWLNENMPRILENAIREEIAARGLIPGSER